MLFFQCTKSKLPRNLVSILLLKSLSFQLKMNLPYKVGLNGQKSGSILWIIFWLFGLACLFLIVFFVLIAFGHTIQRSDCSKCLTNLPDDTEIIEDSSGIRIFPAFQKNGI